ncbi:hypothetical protein BaRGS_00011392 [Batillaria attramentaria]|uniref:Major facilitator superfamily (MFS) profile domain-containing protein n=1 Tax=Batillaria attramentaria TaxID=370345 RepID=A0ABD0LD67_9CAEN
MKFDDVLRQIGEFGPYQKRVFFFASLTGVFCAFEALSVIFIFYIPPHRFGRKIPFYVGALVLIGGGFGIAFTQNMHTVNLCRFLMGIARISTFINAMVVGMEIVGPSTRKNIVVLIDLTWCLGEFLLLVFAHFIRNWRWLEIALSVPTVIYLAYWWLIPESPRWLASRGREQEAVKILEKIVHANNTQLPEVGDAKELLESEKTLSIRHTFRSRELIVRLLIVFCNLFVVAMVYYGMTLNITNLSGNVFVNFAISAAVETLGYVLPYFFLDRLGRKPVYIVSMLAAGTALVGSIIPVMLQAPNIVFFEGMVIMAISMVGRFFVCVCFLVMYLYGAELFPTVVRTSTMGVGLTFSRIGSIVSAYIADVGILVGGRFQHALPLVLMGTPAFLVGLLSLWLPETKGTPLPDTLDDVENTVVKRKCFGCTRSPRDVQELTVVEKNHEARPDSQGNSLSC